MKSSPILVGGDRAREAGELLVEVVDAARLNDAARPFTSRPIQEWLQAGHSASAILAGVRAAASRPGYQPHKVFSLGFFGAAVAQAAASEPVAPRPISAAEREAERAHLAAIEARIEATLAGVGRRAA